MYIITKEEFELNVDSKYFGFDEVKCKNCCNMFWLTEKSKAFLKILNHFRKSVVKKPVRLTNLYRCPSKNQKIGGSKDSAHLEAIAVDMFCDDLSVDELYRKALKSSLFSGLGVYEEGFIHADIKNRNIFWCSTKKHGVEYFKTGEEALKRFLSEREGK
ncbi:MAG TPA: hypothetical protein DHW82_14210 [Spirochaetia bacterium]|nr:MAG: hypothetical protein A2Y41_00350 [Spirochaetes bacterium GWB1_36_13]HCL58144.1 hypothetical protein [Spirochaetia bacterium]